MVPGCVVLAPGVVVELFGDVVVELFGDVDAPGVGVEVPGVGGAVVGVCVWPWVPIVLRPLLAPVPPPACPPDCATAHAPHKSIVPANIKIFRFIFLSPSMVPIARWQSLALSNRMDT